jgi:hypothetical protein
MKIWLDDKREPPGKVSDYGFSVERDDIWFWAKGPKEFVNCVHHQIWIEIKEISFDHDLGIKEIIPCPRSHYGSESRLICPVCHGEGEIEKEITGYDCARWLILTYKLLGKELPKLSIHSQNPVGRERLERLFEEINK